MAHYDPPADDFLDAEMERDHEERSHDFDAEEARRLERADRRYEDRIERELERRSK